MKTPIAVHCEHFIAGYEHVMTGDYRPSGKKSYNSDFQRGVDTALFYIEQQWTVMFGADMKDILVWLSIAAHFDTDLIPSQHRDCLLALVRGTRNLVFAGLCRQMTSHQSNQH